MTDSSCCVTDQSSHKCVDLSYDDSHCATLSECCVGETEAGPQNKCLSQVRKCRKLGNAWDPIRSLKPLPGPYLYNEAPGYTTQGGLVLENFGSGKSLSLGCIMKSTMWSLAFGLIIRLLFRSELSMKRAVCLSLIGGVIHCMLQTM